MGEVGHVFEPVFQVTREHIGQGVCQVAMAALSVHQVSVPWLEIHVPQQTLTLVSPPQRRSAERPSTTNGLESHGEKAVA